MLTDKNAILAIEDIRQPVKLEVPEWNDSVYLRWPTASERDEWEIYIRENSTKPSAVIRAKLAAMLVSDETGKRLFCDRDIPALGAKSAPAIDRIFSRGVKMFAVSESEIEELEKN
jgi:hypothetical protein